jgi:predicted metal-dependent hydrolase
MKEFFLKGIGKVIIRKSKKAKRISIRIRSEREILVVLPVWAPYYLAKEFVREKEKWIKKHLADKHAYGQVKKLFDRSTEYSTSWHKLKISDESIENIKIEIDAGTIHIRYPSVLKISDKNVQEAVRYGIAETLRIEAKAYLPGRVKELAGKHGLKYNKIAVKNQKTLWGSCSSSNNINLNIHLMRLPHILIDYVIIHELVHTIHKNHSKQFWKTVDQYVGNGKSYAKKLKNHNIFIHPQYFGIK